MNLAISKEEIRKLSDLELLNLSKQTRNLLKSIDRTEDLIPISKSIVTELCKRILKERKEKLLEYYWFEVIGLVNGLFDSLSVSLSAIHFVNSILQMQSKKDALFHRSLLKKLDRKILFEMVDKLIDAAEFILDRDYWGTVRLLFKVGLLQNRLEKTLLLLIDTLRNCMDQKLEYDLAQLVARILPQVKQQDLVQKIFDLVLVKVNGCFSNKLEYQPTLKVLLHSLLLLLHQDGFQGQLGDVFLNRIYAILADMRQFYTSTQHYHTPNTHPIFGIIEYLFQIACILERKTNSNSAQLKVVATMSEYLKWLILSEYRLDDLCPLESVNPNPFPKATIASICGASHIQSIAEFVILMVKFEKVSIQDLLELELVAVLIASLQVLFSDVYVAEFPTKSGSTQISLLKLTILLLSNEKGREFMNVVPRAIYEHLPYSLAIRIQEYFQSDTQNVELTRKILHLLSLLLQNRHFRTYFSDQRCLQYLVSSGYSEQVCCCKTKEQEALGFMLLKCIENAAMDSAVRFNLRTLCNDLGKQFGIVEFLIENISLSLVQMIKDQRDCEYLNLVFSKSCTMLNEHFGHDPTVTELLIDEANGMKSCLERLVDALEMHVTVKLSLDPFDSGGVDLKADTVLTVCHLLDSVLRTEKARHLFVRQRMMKPFVRITSQLDHEPGTSVLEKMLIRIATDPNMVLQMVEFTGYCDLFDSMAEFRYDSKAIEESISRNRPELQNRLLNLFKYSLSKSSDHIVCFKTALSLAYVSYNELIQSVLLERLQQDHSRIPKSIGIQIWKELFDQSETDSADHLLVNSCLKYLSVKIHQGTWNTNTVPETEPPYLVSLLQYLILSPNGQKMTWLDLKWNNPIKLVFPDESNQILCIERNVIETESPVFQKMLNGSFVESNQVEIPIQESKSGTWVNVLLWMLKYPEWKASELEFDHMHAEEHCEVVFQIFQVSNRYMIESLQDGCVLWIQEMLLHAISQGNPFVPVIIYQWLSESHGILNPSRAHTLTKLCIKACVSTLPKRFH